MAAIRVSPNGRCFVDDQGKPFFWLGDTQWELFHAFTAEDAGTVLKRRKEQGFTAIQVMITGVGEGKLPNVAGERPWLGDDPSTPNEAYFRNVDRVVEAACELGLILVPGVFHQVQRASITVDNARPYARWVAERYADVPNIVWTTYPEAKEEYVPVVREVVAGLQEGDGGTHLITLHPDPSPASSSFIHDEEWLDFNMIQPWQRPDLVYSMVSADYARSPVKPVVMAEASYEGARYGKVNTPLLIRQQAYWSYLAGGHHTYGNGGNCDSPATWRSWIDSPGAAHVGVCRQILTGLREWWDLIPDQSIFAAGAGSGAAVNVAARCPKGEWALVYLSRSTTVSVRLDRVSAEAPITASWLAPTTGERRGIGGVPSTGVASFSTPGGWEDALLLFERRAGG